MASDDNAELKDMIRALSTEMRAIADRLIRIEEKEYSARIRTLEQENRELREWRVEMETKGKFFAMGIAAAVSIIVSGVSAALGYLLR